MSDAETLNPRPAKRAFVRVFLRVTAVLFLLALVLGVVGIALASRADRGWAEYETRRREGREKVQSRWGARLSLVPSVEPGNAWEDYERAYGVLAALPEKDRNVVTGDCRLLLPK